LGKKLKVESVFKCCHLLINDSKYNNNRYFYNWNRSI